MAWLISDEGAHGVSISLANQVGHSVQLPKRVGILVRPLRKRGSSAFWYLCPRRPMPTPKTDSPRSRGDARGGRRGRQVRLRTPEWHRFPSIRCVARTSPVWQLALDDLHE